MRRLLIAIGVAIVALGVMTSFAPTTTNLWQLSHQALIPTTSAKVLSLPTCPSDLSDYRIGFCFNSSTGRIQLRDTSGVRDL